MEVFHDTAIWSVTCHMGSHSVTCYPTQVNTHRLNPSHTGRYSIYLPRRDGRPSDLVDLIAPRPGVEPATFRSRVNAQPPRHQDNQHHRQTDGRTDDMQSQYRAMHYTASCGKKHSIRVNPSKSLNKFYVAQTSFLE